MAGISGANIGQKLAGHTRVGLDTSVWIYQFEANRRYLPLTTHILTGIRLGRQTGVISIIALMELTVMPYKLGQPGVASQYEALLLNFPNLEVWDVSQEIARYAARFRGSLGVRALDALQVATALAAGATAFVTNDYGLVRLSKMLDIIVLDDYIQ